MSVLDTSGPVSLKWHQFSNNLGITSTMLRESNILTDITLVVEEKQLSAHRFILAASSSLFLSLLHPSPHPHPMVYLRGVSHRDMVFLLDFMYKGVVHVEQRYLSSFLKTAEELKIKGLSQSADVEGDDTEKEEINELKEVKYLNNDYSEVNNEKIESESNNILEKNEGFKESVLVTDLSLSEDSSEINSSASVSSVHDTSRSNNRQTLSKKSPVDQRSVKTSNLGKEKQENADADPPSLSARRKSLYGKSLTDKWKNSGRNLQAQNLASTSNQNKSKNIRTKRKSVESSLSSSGRKLSKRGAAKEGLPGVSEHQMAVSASLEAAIENTKQEIRKLEVEKHEDLAFVTDSTDGTIAEVEKVLKLSQEVLGGLHNVDNGNNEGLYSLDILEADNSDNQIKERDTFEGIVLSPEQKSAMIDIMLIKSNSTSTPWKCATCNEVFKSKSVAVKHIQLEHVDLLQ